MEPAAASQNPDERDLTAALRRGEARAFDAVYDRYRGRIYGLDQAADAPAWSAGTRS